MTADRNPVSERALAQLSHRPQTTREIAEAIALPHENVLQVRAVVVNTMLKLQRSGEVDVVAKADGSAYMLASAPRNGTAKEADTVVDEKVDDAPPTTGNAEPAPQQQSPPTAVAPAEQGTKPARKPIAMGPTQYAALRACATSKDGLSAEQVEKAIGVSNGSAWAALNALEGKGRVEKKRDPISGKVRFVARAPIADVTPPTASSPKATVPPPVRAPRAPKSVKSTGARDVFEESLHASERAIEAYVRSCVNPAIYDQLIATRDSARAALTALNA